MWIPSRIDRIVLVFRGTAGLGVLAISGTAGPALPGASSEDADATRLRICARCSPHRMAIPKFASEQQERVCLLCERVLTEGA